MPLMREFNQRIDTRPSPDDDTPTITAIPAIGTAAWHVLFPTKGHASIPATTCNYLDLDTIHKHGIQPFKYNFLKTDRVDKQTAKTKYDEHFARRTNCKPESVGFNNLSALPADRSLGVPTKLPGYR
jgi:hypothetical protein